jgi:hypothetical protein
MSALRLIRVSCDYPDCPTVVELADHNAPGPPMPEGWYAARRGGFRWYYACAGAHADELRRHERALHDYRAREHAAANAWRKANPEPPLPRWLLDLDV